MEGEFLSRGPAGLGDAALLRRAAHGGRDQQHVLPDAARGDRSRRWAAQVPRGLRLRAQGVAAHHAPQASQGGRGRRRLLLRHRGDARRPARARPLPAAAEPEEGPGRAWSRSCDAAARDRGRRSSSGTRPGSTTRSSRRCARASAALCIAEDEERRDAARRHRRLGLRCACGARTTATGICGRAPICYRGQPLGRRCSFSSSTRTEAVARSSRVSSRSFSAPQAAELCYT